MATLIPKSLFWCPQLLLTDYLFDFETGLLQGEEQEGWVHYPVKRKPIQELKFSCFPRPKGRGGCQKPPKSIFDC